MDTMALTIRDASQLWQGIVPVNLGKAVVAGLSADPATLQGLSLALQRFVSPDHTSLLFRPLAPLHTPLLPSDGTPQCAIDLHRRLLLTSWDQERNSVCPTSTQERDVSPSYHLHPDWELGTHFARWPQAAPSSSSPKRPANESIYQVLYGKEMLRFIVENCQPARLEALGGPTVRPFSDDSHEWTREHSELAKKVEIAWLRSASGLSDGSIRSLLLRDAFHVQADLIDRIEQWIVTDECPHGMGLDETTAPSTGPGRQEVILYHFLLTFVIQAAICHPLPAGRGLRRSARLLGRARDAWMENKSPILQGRSPNEIIRCERRRMPVRLEPGASMVDCDCPLCRLAELDHPGPQFAEVDELMLFLDFPQFWSGTDETFFEPAETDETWRQPDDFGPPSWRTHQARKTKSGDLSNEPQIFTWNVPPVAWPTVSDTDRPTPPFDSPAGEPRGPWQRVFIHASIEPLAPSQRLYNIAAYVGELVCDLRDQQAAKSWIDDLNRHFDNLTESVRESPELLQPVIDRFQEFLDTLSEDRESLRLKNEDLQHQLQLMVSMPVG